MAGTHRIILHADLDAFFPSVEIREKPTLAFKPVIVGSDPHGGAGRGVVSSACYNARKYGVKSGMPISTAYGLCPNGVFLPVNWKLYSRVSREVMAIMRRHSNLFEQASVDEAFLDVSSSCKDFDSAKRLALEIKAEIALQQGITCSIGVASNKLVSKIAAKHNKPDGLTVVPNGHEAMFLRPLPISDLWGVGPKMEFRLRQLNIKTIGNLASLDKPLLMEKFGSWGESLYYHARGIDESPVCAQWETKSIGRETTFEKDTSDAGEVLNTLSELCDEVHSALLAEKFFFKSVVLKVRFENFETHTINHSLRHATDSLEVLRQRIFSLACKPVAQGRQIRLVGVRVSRLLCMQGVCRLQ